MSRVWLPARRHPQRGHVKGIKMNKITAVKRHLTAAGAVMAMAAGQAAAALPTAVAT